MKLLRILICVVIFIILIVLANNSKAMLNYQIVGTSTGLVTANSLNVRQGPRQQFPE